MIVSFDEHSESDQMQLSLIFDSDDEQKRIITALYLAYRNIKSEETRQLVSQILNELEG